MATREFCDRCDSQVGDKEGSEIGVLNRYYRSSDGKYLLCANCTKSFKEWFNGSNN